MFGIPGGPKGFGPGGPRGPNDAERKKYLERAKQIERELQDALTGAQLRRLEQIDLQQAGPKIFYETKVIDALKLTSAQRQKIREIEAAVFAELRPEPGGGFRPGGPAPRFEEAKRLGVERILAVLTPEQRARWTELTGTPFRGELNIFREGFGKKER